MHGLSFRTEDKLNLEKVCGWSKAEKLFATLKELAEIQDQSWSTGQKSEGEISRRLRINPLQSDSHFPSNSYHVYQAEISGPTVKIKKDPFTWKDHKQKKSVEQVQCVCNNTWSLHKVQNQDNGKVKKCKRYQLYLRKDKNTQNQSAHRKGGGSNVTAW